MIELLNCDCMDYMAGLEDNAFELAIVDPPYGIGEGAKKEKGRAKPNSKWKGRVSKEYQGGEWDAAPPPSEYFDTLRRISKNQIIWGANHFGNMRPSSGWVVWFKKRFDEVNDFSDAELAYTSYKKGCRLFHLPWIGFGSVNAGESKIHPTQKPVALYRWLIKNYAKPGDRILDTHLGSGSSAIAAHYAGHDFVGCELDKDYFEAAKARVKKETAQIDMFQRRPDETP